jgi:hypothetical protein
MVLYLVKMISALTAKFSWDPYSYAHLKNIFPNGPVTFSSILEENTTINVNLRLCCYHSIQK